MNQKVHGRTYINFDERPSKFMKEWDVNTFDVVIEERFHDWMEEDADVDQNEMYCNALLELLKKVKPDFQDEFLKYQCELLEMPVSWLVALEELIEENNDFFYKAKYEYLIPSWHQHISDRLASYQDHEVECSPKFIEGGESNKVLENPFDIEKVKKHQLHLPAGFPRLKYLLRMRTNYLHHRSKYIVGDSLPFHKQIKLEMSYQKYEKKFYEKQLRSLASSDQRLKIKINGSIKLLAHAFKSMMSHPGYGNAPFLQLDPKEAITFLSKHVAREDAEPIEESNLRSVFHDDENSTPIVTEPQRLPLSHIESRQYYLFDIDLVIEILQTIPNIEYRILFLTRVKTNYLQHRLLTDKERNFETRIKREVTHQKKLLKMEARKSKQVEEVEPRFRINGQINIFAQVLYELLMEFKGADGRPYIIGSKKKIVRFVCKYFVDKNDDDLSSNTLYCLLKPTNGWKRCPLHKRIHLGTNEFK